MTAAVFDKLGVEPLPDERVLWSHVHDGIEVRHVPAIVPWVFEHRRFFAFIAWQAYYFFSSDIDLDWTVVFFGAAILVALIAAWKFSSSIRETIRAKMRPRWMPTTFMSCVITTHRILLLDFEGAAVTILDRSKLDPAVIDFVRGGRGIVFKSESFPDSYAFIANIDHQPALRALDMNRNIP